MVEASLSRRVHCSRLGEIGLVAVAMALAVGMHLWIGLRTDFIPCTLDCGETYEAFVGARNINRFGWRYNGGLQDYSSSPDRATHAVDYVHNPNVGMYYFTLLFALGVRRIHGHAAWLTLPFFAGLVYLYLAIRVVTRDRGLAGLCLLSAASLYLLVGIWGFDAVRVWSWLLTWGVCYHICRGFNQ